MKKTPIALLAMAWLAAGIAVADTPPKGPPGPDMDRMAILLDLNDSQKTAVQQVLEEQREKMRAAREQNQGSDTRPSRAEMQKLHAQMKQETVTKLQGVLTPEQIKKFEALTDRPRHRHLRERDN
ncbi:MAG TPA: Spy/CpxP family protein refolding chaperone [Steroidobacteraceae bacterium]|nr:Spy/CpxP family protein refolding chaperone [Steroidobacteraceae bacterium]